MKKYCFHFTLSYRKLWVISYISVKKTVDFLAVTENTSEERRQATCSITKWFTVGFCGSKTWCELHWWSALTCTLRDLLSKFWKYEIDSFLYSTCKLFILSQVPWRSPSGLHWHSCLYQTAMHLSKKRTNCFHRINLREHQLLYFNCWLALMIFESVLPVTS